MTVSPGTSGPARTVRKWSLWKATAVIDETVPRVGSVLTAQSLLTSGTLRLSGGLVLQAGDLVTSIMVMSGGTGATTPTAQWFCLVRQSDLTVLGKTVDDTTTAWAGVTPKTLALSTPYTATEEMAVYVGVLVAAATPPQMHGMSLGSSNATFAGSPSVGGNSTAGLTNPASLGATAGAITLSGAVFYATVQ